MPVLTRIKSFVRCSSNTTPKTTRQPNATNSKHNTSNPTKLNNAQPYMPTHLGATARVDAETPIENIRVESAPLLATQNWVNANTMKLYFVPELGDLANYDKNTFIDSPLFMQPETVARYRDVLAIIDKLTPEGANIDTITDNIENFSKQMNPKDFFWATALKFSFANKLIGQLQYILSFIQKGNNLPEEDITGKNLIYKPNQKWALQVNKSNLKSTMMTDEEKNTKAKSISSTFGLLINRLFQDMSDKVNDGHFEIENVEKYRKLIQEIAKVTVPMILNHDSIENHIAVINLVNQDIQNMIRNLKR
jgi:hypothetical protein